MGKNQGKLKKFSLSLKVKMMLTSSLLITVGMVSVIIFDYIKNSTYSEHLLSREAQKITETISARTNDWMQYNQLLAEYIGKSMVFDNISDFRKYVHVLNAFEEREEVIQMFVSFENGENVLSKGIEKLPDGFYGPEKHWYKAAIASDKPVVSNAYIDGITNKPCITVSYKIEAKDGTQGVICIDFNLVALREFLDKSKDKELSGLVTILDENINVVIGSKPEYTTHKLEDIDPALKRVETLISKKDDKILQITDKDGKDWVCFLNKTYDYGWYVLYRIPKNIFYATQITNMIESMVIGAVLTFIAIVLSMFTVSRSLKQLGKFQKIMIDASSSNDLTVRIPAESNDELGKIADSMNMFISKVQEIVSAVKSATNEVATSNIAGMDKPRWSPVSFNLGNYVSTSDAEDYARQAKEGGYGAMMCFNLRPRNERDALPVFQAMARGAYDGLGVICTDGNTPRNAGTVSGGFTITYDMATAE